MTFCIVVSGSEVTDMKSDINGIRSKIKRSGRRAVSVLMALILFVGAFNGIVFFTWPERAALAAEGDGSDTTNVWLETDYKTGVSTRITEMITLDSKTMNLYLKTDGIVYTDASKFKVVWSVDNTEEQNIISVAAGSQQTTGIVTAKKAGTASVQVYVYEVVNGETGQQLKMATMTVKVQFGISTADPTKMKTINNNNALVLYTGQSYQMGLNVGEASDATWGSDNSGVCDFLSATRGYLTATGAGHTTIWAQGQDENERGILNVYVVPMLSKNGVSGTYASQLYHTIESGGYLYADANFDGTIQAFNDKVYWRIEDVNGNQLADTNTPKGELIQVAYPNGVYDNTMQITGTAGQYFMYFYAAGSYSSFPAKGESGDGPYTPSTVSITISSSIEDKNEILGIGDIYNLVEAFNLSETNYKELFSTPTLFLDNGEINPEDFSAPGTQYATLNTVDNTITALREGKVAVVIKVNDKAKVQTLKGTTDTIPDYYVYRFTITDKITLSTESLTMMVGQEHSFHVSIQSNYSGPITWTSSDPSSVSIDGSGVNATAKALKETTSDVLITAEMSAGNGIYRRATCYVKVEKAMTTFTLNPADLKQINLDESFLLKAVIPNGDQISEAPLTWQTSVDGIVTIEVEPNKKQATITGVKGGRTTILVTNTLNMTVQRMTVEVLVPIDNIEFTEETYRIPFYQTGKNMMDVITYTPNDATSTDLEWNTSNKSIATIDDTGYLRFVTPGTILLTVRPKYNPKTVMKQVTVIITGGPDNITFSNLKDDHLDIEVSETKTVELKFEPTTAETSLIWKTNLAGIVLVDYDSDKRQLKVVGRKVGEVTVSCRTEDNVYYSFTVTVTQASTGVSFTKDSITLYRGDVLRGTANLMEYVKMIPETSTDTLTFSSRNDKVASVNATTGVVTAVAAGTTYIMVTTSSGRSNSIDVIVIDRVTEIQSSFRTAIVYIGETLTISPTVVPATATNKTIKWYWEPYEAGGTASVNLEEKGTDVDVTGVSKGMVMLTGVSDDNNSVSVTYVLNVKYRNPQYTTVVTLTPKTKYVNVGKTFKVTRKVTGAYKGNKTLKWKSSNKKVATVTSAGKVKAKKVGKATITATAQDGSKAKGKMKVVVRRLVTKIKMNKSSVNLLVGKSTRLSVKVTPSNATVKGVTWKSGDRSIATVDGGKVIAVAPGMVKITATSKDAKKKKTYCWVTVSEPVPITGFDIPNASLTVAKGDAVQSGIVPNPSNATDSIKFWSDNKAVATVSSRGKIKTHRVGKATIYARAANGVEGHVDVTVVDLNRKAVTLRQYDSEQLSVVMINTGVTWYSRDPSIASVDATGLVKGRLPGTTVVYAKVNGVTLGCRVTVKKIK